LTQEVYIPSIILIPLFLLLFGLGAAVAMLYIKLKRTRQKLGDVTKSKQELEGQIQPLELETIKYKLNPHLFKNVLNSIQSHAYQTYYSLDKLANVLDYVLYESDTEMVSLKEELEFVLNLIEINRIKVSPLFDLRIKNKIGQDNKWFKEKIIAPLITVDLIENAFKHSDLQSGDSFISIVFEIEEDDFILTVTNKISYAPALKKAKGGFGSHNFKKRLNIIYSDHFQLNQSSTDGVYTAQLKLNLNGYKAQMSSPGR
jgi:LytS/YehU family sensor histidine kinase